MSATYRTRRADLIPALPPVDPGVDFDLACSGTMKLWTAL
jgi:hypothetical protein